MIHIINIYVKSCTHVFLLGPFLWCFFSRLHRCSISFLCSISKNRWSNSNNCATHFNLKKNEIFHIHTEKREKRIRNGCVRNLSMKTKQKIWWYWEMKALWVSNYLAYVNSRSSNFFSFQSICHSQHLGKLTKIE